MGNTTATSHLNPENLYMSLDCGDNRLGARNGPQAYERVQAGEWWGFWQAELRGMQMQGDDLYSSRGYVQVHTWPRNKFKEIRININRKMM